MTSTMKAIEIKKPYLAISHKASRGWFTLGKKNIAVKKPTKKISEIKKKSVKTNPLNSRWMHVN